MDRPSQPSSASIEEELRLAGVALKTLQAPWTRDPAVRILVRAADATELEIAGTVASLLGSACQNFAVDLLVGDCAGTRLQDWLATDGRFSFIRGDDQLLSRAEYTLVLPAGTAVGTHSMEAMVDSLVQTQALVLRALVDGLPGPVELWHTATLRTLAEAGDPEASARSAGGERWVAGNSLGLHDFRRPKPKLHLRKGAAATLDLNIVVRDLADSAVRMDYEHRIRQLEARLNRAQTECRRLEQGIAPTRGLARVRAIARKGPAYVTARLKARAGRAGS